MNFSAHCHVFMYISNTVLSSLCGATSLGEGQLQIQASSQPDSVWPITYLCLTNFWEDLRSAEKMANGIICKTRKPIQ